MNHTIDVFQSFQHPRTASPPVPLLTPPFRQSSEPEHAPRHWRRGQVRSQAEQIVRGGQTGYMLPVGIANAVPLGVAKAVPVREVLPGLSCTRARASPASLAVGYALTATGMRPCRPTTGMRACQPTSATPSRSQVGNLH